MEDEKTIVVGQCRSIRVGKRQLQRVAQQLDPLGAYFLGSASVAVVQHAPGQRIGQPLLARKDLRRDLHPPLGDRAIVAVERPQVLLEVGAIVRRQIERRRVVIAGIDCEAQVKSTQTGGRRLVWAFERKIRAQGKDAPLLGGRGPGAKKQATED